MKLSKLSAVQPVSDQLNNVRVAIKHVKAGRFDVTINGVCQYDDLLARAGDALLIGLLEYQSAIIKNLESMGVEVDE